MVQFEVDASYETTSKKESTEEPTGQPMGLMSMEFLTLKVGKLSLKALAEDRHSKGQAIKTANQIQLPPQSQAAEIKTSTQFKGPGTYLPQLRFGRTPWLIVGRHTSGTFEEVRVTNVADRFEEWETKNQAELRKLVAVLTELREAVKNEGRSCVAIYERGSAPHAIKIFASVTGKRALPDELIHEFWDNPLR